MLALVLIDRLPDFFLLHFSLTAYQYLEAGDDVRYCEPFFSFTLMSLLYYSFLCMSPRIHYVPDPMLATLIEITLFH